MSLDPTAREANIRDSVKKYFVENLSRTEGLPLTFDRSLATPVIQGDAESVDKWVSVNFGYLDADAFASMMLTIYCCTRKDAEGFKLAQLRDKVMGYLTDRTQTDGMRRITFYRSYESQAWDVIGGLLVQLDPESDQFEAEDGTKYKMLNVRLRWAAKI
jgi:hypothetical protein